MITSISVLLLAALASAAASDKQPIPVKPCTIKSSTSGSFFDLNPLYVAPASDKSSSKAPAPQSWLARGYDYGANFTLNFCGPVVEEVKDVQGVESDLWKNISALYHKDGRTYSIGSESSELVLRGRKLVLNYTNGSPCAASGRKTKRTAVADLETRETHSALAPTRRKSTIISLLCDADALDPKAPKVTVSFVGTDDDECSYFFEARSAAACATEETTPQQLGPGGVFGVILLIALLVYLVGGCMYQRTVQHQRGWKQLPNYALWSGLFSFVIDMGVILTSSCARCMPGRRGYQRVSFNSNGRGRDRHSDDENRLIDELDDEWDD